MTGAEFAPVAFGLTSAVMWGAGDFCGGVATKRWQVYGVIISSQIIGVGLLMGLALAFGEALPPLEYLLLGGLGGLAGTVGIVALYRALASGRMGVAAPVSAVVAAAVPILIGALLEGLPSAAQLAGFGLALMAVWLISHTADANLRMRELGLPLLAGLGFGVFFVIIGVVSDTAVLWPLVAARCASLGALSIVATATRQPRLAPSGSWRIIVLIAVFEVGGNAFYALAGQTGRLDVAAVISSLYPASTVVLAWMILKERIGQTQFVGIVAALAAIVLITL
jgi:drug/metabolite transporter (DMT)-like permease